MALTNSRPVEGRSGLSCPRVATTVRAPRKRPQWLDEHHRRDKLAPVRERWERRTTGLNRELADLPPGSELEPLIRRRRAYALARVQRLTADLLPRLEACGVETLPIACACGLVGAKKTCRQWWLCGSCRARRSPRLGLDIRRGLDAALTAELDRWSRDGGRGMRPQIVLLTLTQAHTGNLVDDHASLADGWRALYKRMHEDHGAFPFVGVWEVTPGRDGLGHVHMHIAVVWRWRDWGRVREQWLKACPLSQRIDLRGARRDGKASSPSSVSKYLGKYLSKGGDGARFTPRMRAEVSAAFYNQRSVLSSVRFWRRVVSCCRKCQERYRLVELEPLHPFDRVTPGTLNLYFHGIEPPDECPF